MPCSVGEWNEERWGKKCRLNQNGERKDVEGEELKKWERKFYLLGLWIKWVEVEMNHSSQNFCVIDLYFSIHVERNGGRNGNYEYLCTK